MFNPLNISKLLDEKKVTKKTFYESLGISKTQLDNILNGKSIPGSDNIEKMANYFNVSMDYFFDRNTVPNIVNSENNVYGDGNYLGNFILTECQKEIDYLKTIIEGKDAVIAEKERTIQMLLDKQ